MWQAAEASGLVSASAAVHYQNNEFNRELKLILNAFLTAHLALSEHIVVTLSCALPVECCLTVRMFPAQTSARCSARVQAAQCQVLPLPLQLQLAISRFHA